MASVAFALWLIGAVIGAPAVPAQGAPAQQAARTPRRADSAGGPHAPTATSG